MTKTNNGIVASNNLKDISSYISEFELKHITTGDILIEVLEKEYICYDLYDIIIRIRDWVKMGVV
ncbi:hypothetical protein CULT_1240025 [[Clostridium] ultunense Esp]|uniref:Uncharacterized protein n=1 Tax=[Clostridium] ultunense Esp TaxID=1288971 RepID=M1Z589_9FIRM|nr:hypothetical protein [Schnuerera ultunensis]CCQ93181.1 hypothetical protein CULT_1240025 [[Clostridium] ultunense Esp]SHD78461.1 conserved protein of unknown function [[Clostridium] ultunense Esp]